MLFSISFIIYFSVIKKIQTIVIFILLEIIKL